MCYTPTIEFEKRGIAAMKNHEHGRRLRIGEIYLTRFDGEDSEQRGWRPGLVFQNNVGNNHSPNTIALPVTSVRKKIRQPTHVFVPKSVGLKSDSIILCENPQCVSKCRLGGYITTLPKEYMAKVAEASLLASSIIAYLDPEILLMIWKRAVALNSAEEARHV